MSHKRKTTPPDVHSLATLRNVGKATLADFALLGITSRAVLSRQDADELYFRMCAMSGRQDPCLHDVFAATIHEARTGEARNWWAFTPARKARQAAGAFPGR